MSKLTSRLLFASVAVAIACGSILACSDADQPGSTPAPGADAASEAQQEAGAPADGMQEPALEAADESSGEDSGDAGEDAAGVDSGDAGEDAPGLDVQEAASATLGVVSVPELAQELQNKDFKLINVHVPYAGEIPGTDANLTYLDVPAIKAFLGDPLDQKVVLYCLSNSMALAAGPQLIAQGYSQVRYLDGGLMAWKSAGHPVEYHDQ